MLYSLYKHTALQCPMIGNTTTREIKNMVFIDNGLYNVDRWSLIKAGYLVIHIFDGMNMKEINNTCMLPI